MMRLLSVLFVVLLCFGCSSNNSGMKSEQGTVVGHWEGSISSEGGSLRLYFHIDRDSAGVLRAVMDSPDQLAYQMPISGVTATNDSLDLRMFQIMARFQGRLAGPDRIEGQWMQGTSAQQVTLTRNDDIAFLRPQEPKPPFPYTEEEFSIALHDNGTLAGTLTLPQGNGPFPLAIMVSGSGMQDRDETIAGHKPFKLLADQLSRNGIASVRYDDRGVGKSEAFANVAADVVAKDVQQLFENFSTHSKIDPKRVGIIGHSEGGLVAGIAARQQPQFAFIVLLASPAIPGDSILKMQYDRLVDTALPPYMRTVQRRSLALIKSVTDSAKLRRELQQLYESAYDSAGPLVQRQFKTRQAFANASLMQLMSKPLLFLVRYDPMEDLRHVHQPVLALYGGKDLQVPPEQNVGAMELALRQKRGSMVEVLDGLNHLFQRANTGKLEEYGTIRETMSTVALERIVSWIKDVTKQ